MARPTQALINLQHIRDNYHLAKQVRGDNSNSLAYAVIKANAYGHGLLPIANALTDADGFAVACMDEALALRHNGITTSILVLEGGYDKLEWLAAVEHNIEMVLHHQSQLAILLTDSIFKQLTLWLKLDSGMNRLGFRLNETPSILQQCQHAGLNIRVLMSHFSCADDLSKDKTPQQEQAFLNTCRPLLELSAKGNNPLLTSTNNSAAILAWDEISNDISRPGIMLYGSSPFLQDEANSQALKPAMTLTSQIIATHTLHVGEGVGYGNNWVADKTTRVGVIAIGYGDGYPRSAPTGTPIWCNGKYLQTLGCVSMDMMCIDITDHDEIDIGAEIELWGEHINVNKVAALCNTISYELFCQLTPRVKRAYKN
jgi:alanine racemase